MLSKIRGIGGHEFYVIEAQVQAVRFHVEKAMAGFCSVVPVKTISGASREHHSRAAECSGSVPPMSSCRPSSLRTSRAAPKRAMVSTGARPSHDEFVNFMRPA
jgi:hypothetical protein